MCVCRTYLAPRGPFTSTLPMDNFAIAPALPSPMVCTPALGPSASAPSTPHCPPILPAVTRRITLSLLQLMVQVELVE